MLVDKHPAVIDATRRELESWPSDEGAQLVVAVARLRDPGARAIGLRALIARKEDVSIFLKDKDPRIRVRATAQGRWPPERFADVLRDRAALVRAWAIVRLADPALASEAAESRAEEERIAAAHIAEEPRVVANLLTDRSWRVRLAAIYASERVRHKDVVPGLIEALRVSEGRVRARCIRALESLTGASNGSTSAAWRKWWGIVKGGFQVTAPRTVPKTDRRAKRGRRTVTTVSFRRIPIESARLTFVIDASRSMTERVPSAKRGSKAQRRWDLVVADLLGVLRRVPTSTQFNVILFRTGIEEWKPKLVRASRGNVAACAKWIGAQSPAGWTNLFDAVERALSDDRVDAIYLLTDGVPSRGAETRRKGILREIDYLNRFRLVQINCVQAGSSDGLGKKWTGFLDDLAHRHDGVSVRE